MNINTNTRPLLDKDNEDTLVYCGQYNVINTNIIPGTIVNSTR